MCSPPVNIHLQSPMAASQPSKPSETDAEKLARITRKRLQAGEDELRRTGTLNGTKNDVLRAWRNAEGRGVNPAVEFPQVEALFRNDPEEVKRRESLAEANLASEEREQALRNGQITTTTTPGVNVRPKPKASPEPKAEQQQVQHAGDANHQPVQQPTTSPATVEQALAGLGPDARFRPTIGGTPA